MNVLARLSYNACGFKMSATGVYFSFPRLLSNGRETGLAQAMDVRDYRGSRRGAKWKWKSKWKSLAPLEQCVPWSNAVESSTHSTHQIIFLVHTAARDEGTWERERQVMARAASKRDVTPPGLAQRRACRGASPCWHIRYS